MAINLNLSDREKARYAKILNDLAKTATDLAKAATDCAEAFLTGDEQKILPTFFFVAMAQLEAKEISDFLTDEIQKESGFPEYLREV